MGAQIIQKSLTTKTDEHVPCGYSMSAIWGFDKIEKKHTFYRRKHCVKKFFSL